MSETATTGLSTMDLEVGDQIGRAAAEKGAFGDGLLWLTVTKIEDGIIYCNRWMFDQKTGWEIDHDQKWGPEYGRTGGQIVKVKL